MVGFSIRVPSRPFAVEMLTFVLFLFPLHLSLSSAAGRLRRKIKRKKKEKDPRADLWLRRTRCELFRLGTATDSMGQGSEDGFQARESRRMDIPCRDDSFSNKNDFPFPTRQKSSRVNNSLVPLLYRTFPPSRVRSPSKLNARINCL